MHVPHKQPLGASTCVAQSMSQTAAAHGRAEENICTASKLRPPLPRSLTLHLLCLPLLIGCRQQVRVQAALAAHWEAVSVAEAAGDAWLLQRQGSSAGLEIGDSAAAPDDGAYFKKMRLVSLFGLIQVTRRCPKLVGGSFRALLQKMLSEVPMVGAGMQLGRRGPAGKASVLSCCCCCPAAWAVLESWAAPAFTSTTSAAAAPTAMQRVGACPAI